MIDNPKAAVDAAVIYYDGVDSTDGNNDTRVAKTLQLLQQLYSFVQMYREWEWMFTEDVVDIASGENNGDLPPAFLDFGFNGGLWDPTRHFRMKQRTKHIIERLRQESVGAQDTNSFGIYGGKVQIPYTASQDLEFNAFYRIKPETLNYDESVWLLPGWYGETVILPGLISLVKGADNQPPDLWNGQFKAGLSQMCANERPIKTETQRLPLAVRRAW